MGCAAARRRACPQRGAGLRAGHQPATGHRTVWRRAEPRTLVQRWTACPGPATTGSWSCSGSGARRRGPTRRCGRDAGSPRSGRCIRQPAAGRSTAGGCCSGSPPGSRIGAGPDQPGRRHRYRGGAARPGRRPHADHGPVRRTCPWSASRSSLGNQLTVLYRRRLGDTSDPMPGPGFHRAQPGRHRPAPAAQSAVRPLHRRVQRLDPRRAAGPADRRATAGRRIRPGDTPVRPGKCRAPGQVTMQARALSRDIGRGNGAFAVISP